MVRVVRVLLAAAVWLAAAVAEADRPEAVLLRALGLTARPRINGPVRVPNLMRDLYVRQASLDTTNIAAPGAHLHSANTVVSYFHQESGVDARFKRENRFRLKFNVTGPGAGGRVTGAEVRLSAEGAGSRVVRVHDIVRPGKKGGPGPLLRLLDAAPAGKPLDVLPAVQRWLEEPEHNHGLLVEASPGPGHVRLRRDAPSAPSTTSEPLLLVYSDDGRNSRPRRAAPKKRRKDASLCQRHPLYVDFADVGWNDWIVAPPGYDAFYCHGDCPFPLADHLNSTNHAIVQTLVHSVSPGAVPKACCVPTHLSSISLLFLDEDNRVVLKNYQDMAVVGCGCR